MKYTNGQRRGGEVNKGSNARREGRFQGMGRRAGERTQSRGNEQTRERGGIQESGKSRHKGTAESSGKGGEKARGGGREGPQMNRGARPQGGADQGERRRERR